MSVLTTVRKRKKVRTLGAVDIIRREAYPDLELDAKANAAEFNGGIGNPGGPAIAVSGILGAEHLGRAGLQPLRHRALAERFEYGVGRGGRGEPRHLRLLRTDGRVLQGSGFP